MQLVGAWWGRDPGAGGLSRWSIKKSMVESPQKFRVVVSAEDGSLQRTIRDVCTLWKQLWSMSFMMYM